MSRAFCGRLFNFKVLLENAAALQLSKRIQLRLQRVSRVNVGGTSGLGHVAARCQELYEASKMPFCFKKTGCYALVSCLLVLCGGAQSPVTTCNTAVSAALGSKVVRHCLVGFYVI